MGESGDTVQFAEFVANEERLQAVPGGRRGLSQEELHRQSGVTSAELRKKEYRKLQQDLNAEKEKFTEMTSCPTRTSTVQARGRAGHPQLHWVLQDLHQEPPRRVLEDYERLFLEKFEQLTFITDICRS